MTSRSEHVATTRRRSTALATTTKSPASDKAAVAHAHAVLASSYATNSLRRRSAARLARVEADAKQPPRLHAEPLIPACASGAIGMQEQCWRARPAGSLPRGR